jgi:hypothetical protein
MKTCLEFGNIGGRHTEIVLPTVKLGVILAGKLQHVFTDKVQTYWKVSKTMPRQSWNNSEYFIALSILDGVSRGPASTSLWRK